MQVKIIAKLILLIYRPRRDGRLSWPGWLTQNGHFTEKVWSHVNHRSGKVGQPKTKVLTTDHATNSKPYIVTVLLLLK